MINWTEEDVKFICNNMINPAMEQMTKYIESSYDSHSRVIEHIVDVLNKTNYQQQRETAFLRFLVMKHLHLDPQGVNEFREAFFKQFDELNEEIEYEK